jgi:tetratricopeptide (TPR) repeat protein
MQGTRRWANKSAAVVIGALAFIFAPLQNAIAQSLSLDEISAIRERALVGKATQADKRRLYKSLSPEDAHGLLRFQGSSGNIRGASLYRTVVNAVAEVNGVDNTKLLAIIDAIIEAEKPPGEDEYRQGLKHLADKQYDLAIPEFDKAIGLGYSNSYFVRGQAWLQKQNYEQAIADFTLANRKDSRDVFVYFYRARAYEQKGDRKNAIADYRTTQAIAWDDNLRKQIRAALERLGAEQTKKR